MGIEISGVSKRFGKTTALTDINLCFEENGIYGILGRNGAGKSTLLNIVANRLVPCEGTVSVDKESATENDRAQEKIFLMSEVNTYPSSMKCSDILKWTKEFYPSADETKGKELAERFSLDMKKPIGNLSTGYKTIIKFIAAMMSCAKYTLLDEPILGLDANCRELAYRIILEEYARQPRCILISTHIIEEVEEIIENVIIINDGKILVNESVENILSKGYSVTGEKNAVDGFIKDKKVIGEESLGNIKCACVYGYDKICSVPDGLEISPMKLQKLFIELTGEKGEK